MTALWAWLATKWGRMVAGIAAVLAIIGAIRLDARRDAMRDLDAKAASQSLKARETRDEIEADIRRSGDDDVRKRLRERWRRD